jgi:hypothetical protein
MFLRNEHGYSLVFDFTTFAAAVGALPVSVDSGGASNFVRI